MHSTVFTNELGNRIHIAVKEFPGLIDLKNVQYDGIRVEALGPSTQVDHTWTRLEAEELHTLLGLILNK